MFIRWEKQITLFSSTAFERRVGRPVRRRREQVPRSASQKKPNVQQMAVQRAPTPKAFANRQLNVQRQKPCHQDQRRSNPWRKQIRSQRTENRSQSRRRRVLIERLHKPLRKKKSPSRTGD